MFSQGGVFQSTARHQDVQNRKRIVEDRIRKADLGGGGGVLIEIDSAWASPCNGYVRPFVQKTTVGLLMAATLAAGVWFLGRPAYRHYKESRSLGRAQEYLAKGEYSNASLSARQTLMVNPENLGACRVMAELCQISRAPQLLDWRRKIVGLSPTLENKVLLASAALRTQDPPYPLSVEILGALEEEGRNYGPYHEASAELALKTRRPAVAAAHFSQAARLDPGNPQHQFNLSVLRLQSTNRTEAAEARMGLETLARGTNLGTVALRWLVVDRVDNKDWPSAEGYSRQLIALPGSNLEDRLQHLNILLTAKKPEFEECMQNQLHQCATNASAIYGISSWMISRGLVDQAVSWLTNLPPGIRSEKPVALALVDCYLAGKSWKKLENLLEEGPWGEQDYLRLAFLSRAAAELNALVASEGHWRAAVRAAGDKLSPLCGLVSLAGSWGWKDCREALLWQIAERFPKERWAYQELEHGYQVSRNTRGLNKVYAAMMNAQPGNILVRNNFATTAFLLKQGLPAAHEVAKEIHQQNPDNAVICSTYAYSLHLQGRNKEAIEQVSRIKVEDRESPAFAVYFAAISLQNGQTNQANHYLSLTSKTELLPEERALIEDLRRAM